MPHSKEPGKQEGSISSALPTPLVTTASTFDLYSLRIRSVYIFDLYSFRIRSVFSICIFDKKGALLTFSVNSNQEMMMLFLDGDALDWFLWAENI